MSDETPRHLPPHPDGEPHDHRLMAHLDRPPSPVAPSPRPETHGPRPLVERIGMAAIAVALAALFAGVAVASWAGGEVFLAAMAAIGALMTLWVGAITLLRG